MSSREHDPLAFTHEAEDREGREDAEKQAQRVAVDDLVWLMSEKRGRRIVWSLLGSAQVFQLTFTGEALSSAFNEGKRNIGLKYLAAINEHCPERYALMLKEQKR